MVLREGQLLLAPEGLKTTDGEPSGTPTVFAVAGFTKAKKRKALLVASLKEIDIKVKLVSDQLPEGWEVLDNRDLADDLMEMRK